MARFLAVNALLFGLFWLAGAGIWYWGVWVLAMATWLPLVTRIRNIAEHACTSTGEDPFSHARTTHANPIERLLIAPYWVNYHAEHHLFMYLPCYRLPEAHRLLIEKGPDRADGSAPRLSRRDAAGDLKSAGLTTLLRRHQRLNAEHAAQARRRSPAKFRRPRRTTPAPASTGRSGPCPIEQP